MERNITLELHHFKCLALLGGSEAISRAQRGKENVLPQNLCVEETRNGPADLNFRGQNKERGGALLGSLLG